VRYTGLKYHPLSSPAYLRFSDATRLFAATIAAISGGTVRCKKLDWSGLSITYDYGIVDESARQYSVALAWQMKLNLSSEDVASIHRVMKLGWALTLCMLDTEFEVTSVTR
jgi:hypothetical protein